MKATLETLALIRQADESVTAAAKAGVKAVMALIHDNLQFKFPHGKAAELAAILKDGKVTPASAKRYAELCAMAVNAIAHQGALAASKAPNNQTAKGAARDMALADNLSTLASMASMAKVREWAKENGPKVKAKAKAPTEAPTEAPIAPNLEALGQMREIRETLAMVNAGQITAGEGLATIATIAGIQLAKSLPAPASKTARTRAKRLEAV